MGWAGNGVWMWLLMAPGTVGFWVLVALTVRALIGGCGPAARATSDPLSLLQVRLTRGEITPEDFHRGDQLLSDGHGASAPPQDRPPPPALHDR